MILSKKVILSQIYGGLVELEMKIVDVFICKIRSKLFRPAYPPSSSPFGGGSYRGYTNAC